MGSQVSSALGRCSGFIIGVPLNLTLDFMNHRRVINSLVKPWEELSILLSKPLAMQPEQSDFITKAEALSVFISHYPECMGLKRKEVDDYSHPNRLMTDVADASKHYSLKDNSRNNSLRITSDFEFRINSRNENEYKFIGNVITVMHNSEGEFDFMLCARDATEYLLEKQKIRVTGFGEFKEFEMGFFPTVKLDYDPALGANMNDVSIRFKTREAGGNLVLADPPGGWDFEIRDLSIKI